MTRRYDEPVEVRRRDDDPAEFLWRDRFYAVREVLAHWVETATWWQPAAAPDGGERERRRLQRQIGERRVGVLLDVRAQVEGLDMLQQLPAVGFVDGP